MEAASVTSGQTNNKLEIEYLELIYGIKESFLSLVESVCSICQLGFIK